jgi:Uncharacterized protein conserved in bacteria
MRGLFAGFWLLLASSAVADYDSPVGTWKTIDDKTGRPKAIVQITEQSGELTGKVVQVLESSEGPHPLCRLCEGDRKDQPVEGMTVLWNVKKTGDSWGDGEILDPENGKIYRVRLTPLADGQKLDVRGYIGVSVIGRSQIWERQKQESVR